MCKVSQNCHGKTQNLRTKTKYLTAKPKTSRQKRKPHGKTENPHGKIKDFTAKTKYLTAKANTHGKTKAILFLLWSIWFCREVFGFSLSAKSRNHAIATNNAFEANTSLLSSLDSQSLSKIVTGGELPSARSSAAMAAVGKKLYVFGGLSRDSGWFNDVYALDTGEH